MLSLTIVTITYNNFDQLEATIKSVSALIDGSEIDCLIINGGSCAKTQSFLESLPTEKFRSISERDRGISDAFSKGARNALGEHVMFLNSGDRLIDTTYIRDALIVLKNTTSNQFVFSDLILEDVQIGEILFRAKPNFRNLLGRGMPYPHPTMIVKRSLFEELGYFDETYFIGMDYEWVCRLVTNGAQGHYIERASVAMDGSGVSAKKEREAIQENARALLKNHLYDTKNRLAILRRYTQFLVKACLEMIGFEKATIAIRRRIHNASNRARP